MESALVNLEHSWVDPTLPFAQCPVISLVLGTEIQRYKQASHLRALLSQQEETINNKPSKGTVYLLEGEAVEKRKILFE